MLVVNLVRLVFNLMILAVSCAIGLVRLIANGVIALIELASEDDDSVPGARNSEGGAKCHAR